MTGRLAQLGLRARLTAATVGALALVGALAAVVLLAAVERDGRAAVDDQLRDRAEQVLRRPLGFGHGGQGGRGGRGPGGRPRPGPPDALLAGSGAFVQVTVGGDLVAQRGDVPADPPAVPEADGTATIDIDGTPWRSLTRSFGPARLQVLQTLAPVEARVARTRRIVVALGLAALAVLGAMTWGLAGLALRPLERLRDGARRIGGTEDLRRPLPDDDGPEEVRQLARSLNEMLGRVDDSAAALQRALDATRRFAADAGHELRTPLTGLRANLDVLARNPDLDPAERAALVAELAAEQERMAHLLEGLQALARGDAADALPRERVELADVVEAALYAARRRHPATSFAAGPQADGAVDGWPGGLRLVVDNLLDNAALHGGEEVRVSVRADGGTLVLAVADDGPGIAPGDRARVLEPFARGAAATAPGSGLGLAIVAQQAALHGGELVLGDAPGGGLCAEVRLPRTA